MVINVLSFDNRQKKSLDVKDAMRQLLNRYKKQLQENMHKVSITKHILPLSTYCNLMLMQFISVSWIY